MFSTSSQFEVEFRATWSGVKARLARASAATAAVRAFRILEGVLVVAVLIGASGAIHGVIIKSGGPAFIMTLASYALHVAALTALVFRFRLIWQGLAALWPAAPYLILAAGSYAWSSDPAETMKSAIGLSASAIFVAYFSRRFAWPTIVEFLFWTFAGLAIACVLYAVAFPSLGMSSSQHPGAWSGVFVEKNKLGGFCCFLLAACCTRGVVRPRAWASSTGVGVLALALLVLCTSKTALLAGLAVLVTFGFLLFIRRGPITGLIGTSLAVVGVGAGLFMVSNYLDSLLILLGKSPDLTSRTAIWESVRHLVADRPLGFGYGAFWNDARGWASVAWVEQWLDFRPKHGHNAWVDARAELGQPGPLALGLMVATALLSGLTRPRGDLTAYWAAPFMVFVVLTSLTETAINAPKNLEAILLMLTLAVAAPLPRDWRPKAAVFVHRSIASVTPRHRVV